MAVQHRAFEQLIAGFLQASSWKIYATRRAFEQHRRFQSDETQDAPSRGHARRLHDGSLAVQPRCALARQPRKRSCRDNLRGNLKTCSGSRRPTWTTASEQNGRRETAQTARTTTTRKLMNVGSSNMFSSSMQLSKARWLQTRRSSSRCAACIGQRRANCSDHSPPFSLAFAAVKSCWTQNLISLLQPRANLAVAGYKGAERRVLQVAEMRARSLSDLADFAESPGKSYPCINARWSTGAHANARHRSSNSLLSSSGNELELARTRCGKRLNQT